MAGGQCKKSEFYSMPQVSRLFFKTAVVFLIIGLAMGLHMSMTANHDVIGAHAHTNLLGWVTSALFGAYYALNPGQAESRLAVIHFPVYTAGMAAMTPSLYLLLRGFAAMEPLVAISSLVTFAGAGVSAVIVFKPEVQQRAEMTPASLG